MRDRFHHPEQPELAQVGRVLSSGTAGVGISSTIDARSIKVAAPYGIYSKPLEGEEVLLLPICDGSYVSVGLSKENATLKSGEVMIKASSGAFILLKQNGEVQINGTIIKANGA